MGDRMSIKMRVARYLIYTWCLFFFCLIPIVSWAVGSFWPNCKKHAAIETATAKGERERKRHTRRDMAQWRYIRQLAYFVHHIFSQFSVYNSPLDLTVSSSLCLSLSLFVSLPLTLRLALRSIFSAWLVYLVLIGLWAHEIPFPFPLPLPWFIWWSGSTHIGISQKYHMKRKKIIHRPFILSHLRVSMWNSQFSFKVECVRAFLMKITAEHFISLPFVLVFCPVSLVVLSSFFSLKMVKLSV